MWYIILSYQLPSLAPLTAIWSQRTAALSVLLCFYCELFYSDSCGYSSHFEELATQIRSSVPSASVLGKEGRRGKMEGFRRLLCSLNVRCHLLWKRTTGIAEQG